MLIEKVETGYLSENCYVISIGNDSLVIDPGDDFDKIKKLIAGKNVLSVLITHYHFDHVGVLDEILKNYNVSVTNYKSSINQNIGPFSFEIIKTPGHKEDAVTYYFKEEKVMFVGDFIFKGTIGRCDLEGGDFNEMLLSINKIKEYDKRITLYPGHGNKTTIKEELETNYYMKGEENE